jgi:hypothetical protein
MARCAEIMAGTITNFSGVRLLSYSWTQKEQVHETLTPFGERHEHGRF